MLRCRYVAAACGLLMIPAAFVGGREVGVRESGGGSQSLPERAVHAIVVWNVVDNEERKCSPANRTALRWVSNHHGRKATHPSISTATCAPCTTLFCHAQPTRRPQVQLAQKAADGVSLNRHPTPGGFHTLQRLEDSRRQHVCKWLLRRVDKAYGDSKHERCEHGSSTRRKLRWSSKFLAQHV